ncbi:Putative phage tail protein [Sphingobium faniae]|nr:Putative phage tail protein [Sphingobium faniae]
MATVVLTAVGSVFGGPIGAAIGGLVGNVFDHGVLFRPKGRQGPRLQDLHIQTSTYGAQIPKLFGTMRVAGTVIWATDLRETKTKSGGGKGRPSVTSYSYSASFAVALSARAVRSVKRIWADGNLLRGASGDFKAEMGGFRLHKGDEDQAVDPLIASKQGMAQATAHRGIAYAVFEDLSLADYGNRIPSLTFEVEADEGAVPVAAIAAALGEGRIGGEGLASVDGYAAGGSDLEDALAPLVEAYGLALTAGEDGLAIMPQGRTASREIPASSWCGRVNGRVLDALERSGAAADAVPVALSVRHYDASRDYQAGVQRVTRPGPGRLEQGLELPAVLGGGAARGLAAERLGANWAGRAALTLRCGWEALCHQPGAAVAVEGEAGLWRIEEREWEAMAVRLSLRRVPGQGGIMPAGASSGAIVREADAPHGPTMLMLADLPNLKDGASTAPILVAAAAGEGAGWRGAALFVMNELDEAVPAGRSAPRATMGQADAALPAGSVTLVDEHHALSVTLLAEDMELADANEQALAQGSNLCLVGNELIQFSRAVRTGLSSYRLTGLRRGLRGTEWAMAGHGAAEGFLLLEEDRLAEPLAALGMEGEAGATLRLSAIGIGDAEPVEAALAIRGEALKPPAPVHVRINPDGAGGWRIGWTRRSRAGWRWSSGGDVPLGEESERYEVRVLRGAEVKRSVEIVEPGWSYDAAMIFQDMAGTGAGECIVEIRQIGSRAMGRAAHVAIPV